MPPIHKTLEFGKAFLVTCDAREKIVSKVLSQEGRPLEFESCKIRDDEWNYHAHELELLAIALEWI